LGDGRILGIRKWFSRFAVALGGFLIFVGIIFIGVFLIDYFGMINLNILETENLQNLPFFMLFALGLVDLIAGILLWRR